MKHRTLLADLEKIYSYYNSICETCNYDCMKCKLCFLNHTESSYFYFCVIVAELVLSIREYCQKAENEKRC